MCMFGVDFEVCSVETDREKVEVAKAYGTMRGNAENIVECRCTGEDVTCSLPTIQNLTRNVRLYQETIST